MTRVRNISKGQPSHDASWTPALFTVLRISRWLGVAPVVFSGTEPRIELDQSRISRIYDFVFCCGIISVNLVGLSLDIVVGDDQAIRARGGMTTVAWIAELFLVLAVKATGYFGARRRIIELVAVLKEKEKIDKQVARWQTLPRRKYQAIMVGVIVTFLCFLSAYDMKIFFYYYTALMKDKGQYNTILSASLYAWYCVSFISIVLLQLEFCAVAFVLLDSMRMVNKALAREIQAVQKQHIAPITPAHIDISNYNKVVDTMYQFTVGDPPAYFCRLLPPASFSSVRRLTQLQSSLCGLTRAADAGYSQVVLLLLLSDILHLVVSPYYVFMTQSQSDAGIGANLDIKLLWLTTHSCMLFSLIEPCHRTTNEAKITVKLVSQLSSMLESAEDPLREQLETLQQVLVSCTADYSPMQMCTLTRELLTSIVSGVTTYLMILVQFQKVNDNIKK